MSLSLADCGSTLSSSVHPKKLEITDDDGDWERYLKIHCKDGLENISKKYPFTRSLHLDYSELEASGVTGIRFADEILDNPGKAIGDIKSAIKNHGLVRKYKKESPEISIRFFKLPLQKRVPIRNIRSQHVGKFISIEGIVRKATIVQPRITLAVYRCPSGHRTVKAQSYGSFVEPDGCSADGCTCSIKRMELLTKMSTFVDSQKILLQESPEGMRGGNQPESITCVLDDDICGMVNPGDWITLNGIVRVIERKNQGERSTTFEKYIEVNSIEIAEKEFSEIVITEEDEKEIIALSQKPNLRDLMIQSMAPTIYGMEDLKEVYLYQLVGGVAKIMPDGTRLRGDIHSLASGDPGKAKTQLIRFVVQLSPRGIFTSGQSSSAAGLTAAAVKDNFGGGVWTLEAGALVLADMGVAGIDEMDKMDRNDRSAIHEAMEQQSISIAKAGITTTLKCRCAIMGAANPKHGRFDDYTPIGEQIDMPASLLSRFDFIFILRDVPEKEYDNRLASHILKSHQIGEKLAVKEKTKGGDKTEIDTSIIEPPVEAQLFIKYIAYAKRIIPILSDEAIEILLKYYGKIRGLASESKDKPVPITARQLEALVRASEAIARSRLSKVIEKEDAERTVSLVDKCLKEVAIDPETGEFDCGPITTGKTQRGWNMVEAIDQAIKDLNNNGFVNEETLIKAVVSRGFNETRVNKHISQLKRDGKFVDPQLDGNLKVMY